ncbi:Protein of unknown function DUF2226 [Methanocaldococcus sp. FS406-22]|uniref:DUF2226 domain-containing protein n=1 Tax=Methanocaldococcus sp. (strain FS406-22) TaxID=644281 RepID=UPI0001BF1DC5|nr:DUF2226 domain-containing protein [Methanocaldococcus sp. FS406-22]ADC68809.1 Protein of unknown function DUF2226 [Methanocaldococcus sp. FS406-22]
MIKVVDGELIRTLTDGNLDDLVTEVNVGYILILVKEGNKLHEGYIFVEDGEIVGSYYTDNESTEIFGNKEKILELLNYENKVIELYRYNKDKINLMKWLYPEIFVVKKTKEEKETKKEEREDKEEKYLNIKLDIPLDVPLESNTKDFQRYLEDNKYIVVNVYKKTSGKFENGYIIYKGKTPIAAAYECDFGVLLGKDAYEKVEQLLKDENAIIDVYEYNERKTNVLLEIYPQMKIVDEEQSTEKEEIQKDIEEFVKEEELEEAKELSREELLKKLGIKEPDDTWIETILEDMFRPSEEELNELKEKLENEIVNRIKMMEGVDDVKTNLKVKWENGRYYLFGDVNVKRKRILGIIKKDIDPSIVKFEIDKIIRKFLSRYTSRISINVE